MGSSLDGSSRLGRVIAQLEALKVQNDNGANPNKNEKSDGLTKNDAIKCDQKLTDSLRGDFGMTPSQKVGALLHNRKIAPGDLLGSKPERCDTVKDATTSKNVNKKGDISTPNPHVLPEHVSRLPMDSFVPQLMEKNDDCFCIWLFTPKYWQVPVKNLKVVSIHRHLRFWKACDVLWPNHLLRLLCQTNM